jgi:hypothetical protein
MIQAELDRKEHERNLKAFGKAFGDSTQQAVVRWGVQIAREFAGSTQPFGRGKKAQEAGRGAIYRDALRVIIVADGRVRESNRVLRSAAEINDWIEQHRRKGKTKEIPPTEKKIVYRSLFEKTIAERAKKSGIAKDGWIDAGQNLATHQKGAERITIGKGYIKWAQKPETYGDSTAPKPAFSPFAVLHNHAEHSPYVLASKSETKAVKWALKKTIKWYQKNLEYRERKAKT